MKVGDKVIFNFNNEYKTGTLTWVSNVFAWVKIENGSIMKLNVSLVQKLDV